METWAYLSVSVSCSVLIAHVLRHAKQNNAAISAVLLVNYLIAFLIALAGAKVDFFSLATIALGMVTGVFFITNFFIFAESVHKNGLGISVVSMRLSLSVPIIGSLLFFDERMSVYGWVGVALIGLSLYFIQPSLSQQSEQHLFKGILIALFLISGFGDFALKIFERKVDSGLNESAFMSIVFGTAMVLAFIKMKKENAEIGKKEWLTGIALGVPNVFSSVFLIKALMQTQAVYIYPIANTSVIVLGAMLGVWYWKDFLSKKQWLGIGMAIVALLTLIQGI
ncbi:hypothetical protein EP331_11960 [bacterium]|nr:MAG: hypothetical protein EP331_11960 [bacterium]